MLWSMSTMCSSSTVGITVPCTVLARSIPIRASPIDARLVKVPPEQETRVTRCVAHRARGDDFRSLHAELGAERRHSGERDEGVLDCHLAEYAGVEQTSA